jgi:hypothetical protein
VQGDPANFNDPSGLNRDLCADVDAPASCARKTVNNDCTIDGGPINCGAAAALHDSGLALTPAEYVVWWQSINADKVYQIAPDIEIPNGMTYQEAVNAYLEKFGILALIDRSSMVWDSERNGYTFRFSNPSAAKDFLKNNSNFANGPLGALHMGEVGFPNWEYRSWGHAGANFSLQVTVGGRVAWADIDRYNPYDVVGFFAHGLFEVLPFWKKKWPWP